MRAQLALVAWKHNFFNHFTNQGGISRLTLAVLRQIERQRNGEDVDSSLLKQVIESYGELQVHRACGTDTRTVLLGIDQADAQRANLEVYGQHFQTPFLEATRQYYIVESKAFVANNSVSDYMKKAEDRLDEEAQRVTLYLNDSTRKDVSSPIKFEIETELRIDCSSKKPARRYWSRITPSCFGMSFRLSSMPTGLEVSCMAPKKFYQLTLELDRSGEDVRFALAHTDRFGASQKAVRGACQARRFGRGPEGSASSWRDQRGWKGGGPGELLVQALWQQLMFVQDPKAYIEALLEVHSTFGEVVNGPFHAELGFNASLDKVSCICESLNAHLLLTALGLPRFLQHQRRLQLSDQVTRTPRIVL